MPRGTAEKTTDTILDMDFSDGALTVLHFPDGMFKIMLNDASVIIDRHAYVNIIGALALSLPPTDD